MQERNKQEQLLRYATTEELSNMRAAYDHPLMDQITTQINDGAWDVAYV